MDRRRSKYARRKCIALRIAAFALDRRCRKQTRFCTALRPRLPLQHTGGHIADDHRQSPRLQVSDREIHASAFAGSKGWVMHLVNVSGTLVKPPETVNHSDVFHYFKQSAETIGNERVVPFFSTAVTLFSA